jgi:hypothetical protein
MNAVNLQALSEAEFRAACAQIDQRAEDYGGCREDIAYQLETIRRNNLAVTRNEALLLKCSSVKTMKDILKANAGLRAQSAEYWSNVRFINKECRSTQELSTTNVLTSDSEFEEWELM